MWPAMVVRAPYKNKISGQLFEEGAVFVRFFCTADYAMCLKSEGVALPPHSLPLAHNAHRLARFQFPNQPCVTRGSSAGSRRAAVRAELVVRLLRQSGSRA